MVNIVRRRGSRI